MKHGWLLYDDPDLSVNRDFAAFVTETGARLGLSIETVCLSQLQMGLTQGGALDIRKDGQTLLPDFVISRQRDALVSRQFEQLGVSVFNNAEVCALCNDKRRTHQFLAKYGVPMLETMFSLAQPLSLPAGYPRVVKPACSHGGDRVALVQNDATFTAAMARIAPAPALCQQVASEPGRDLRVYVVFGQCVAGVLRTAKSGVVSNYKQGGEIALHTLTAAEQSLAEQVIAAFAHEGAPLCFAGVDLLYHEGHPVLGEVEDVVGSRMLYKTGGPDVVALYLAGIRKRLTHIG